MNWGDLLISTAVLALVGLAAESGQARIAAVAATMPTGVPLALWMYSKAAKPQSDGLELEQFMTEVLKGVLCTLSFAVAGWIVARQGRGVPGVIVAGYLGWAAAWFLLRRL